MGEKKQLFEKSFFFSPHAHSFSAKTFVWTFSTAALFCDICRGIAPLLW